MFQKDDIDYKETFSPFLKNDSLRIILTLVTHYDLELYQIYVNITFLNVNLEEKDYMDKLEGLFPHKRKHGLQIKEVNT